MMRKTTTRYDTIRKYLESEKRYYIGNGKYMSNQKKGGMRRTRVIDKTKIVQSAVITRVIGISAVISFVIFFMIQVIWADWFVSNVPDIQTGSESMYWIQLLLMIGLFSALGISIILAIRFGDDTKFREDKKSQRMHIIESAIAAFFVVFFGLIVISYISMFIYDSSIFSDATIFDYFGSIFQVMTEFVIYVYPNPTGFWLISIGMFYAIYAVIFIFKVPRSRKMDAKAMKNRVQSIRDRIQSSKRDTERW